MLKRRRHTCIICGKKRYEYKMKPILSSSWVCCTKQLRCCDDEEIKIATKILKNLEQLKKLKKIKLIHIIGK